MNENIKLGPLPCPVCKTHALFDATKLIKRQQRFSSTDQIRWINASPSRSGSSVIYQLMDFFDEGATVKTHHIQQQDCPLICDVNGVVCAIRHPYDMYASLLKMFNDKKPEEFSFVEDENIVKKLDKELETTKGLIVFNESITFLYNFFMNRDEVRNVLFLKYEDCMKNNSLRIEKLSEYMGVNYTEKEIQELSKKYSLNNNLKRIESGEHRTEDKKGTIAAKNIYFESNHIGPNLGKSIGNSLPEEIKKYIYEKHKMIFDYFNYEA